MSEELGRSFEEYGFAVIRDHGIPLELIDRAEAMSKAFFALPAEVKQTYKVEGGGGARGYTPFGVETAKDAKVHDLKEFWHVGRELPAGHPLAEYMAPNVWPGEVPAFRETFSELYAAFEKAGARVLEAIALHLKLPQNWFAATVEDGNSVMRLLHYPPLTSADAEGAIRAAAHGDINTITLLLGAEEAGLELLTAKGEWKAIDTPPGALVVNIGDMLDRLTNHRLKSTPAPGDEPQGRGGLSRALFDALLPAFPARFRDRDAAGMHRSRTARGAPRADQQPRIPPAAPARDQAGLRNG